MRDNAALVQFEPLTEQTLRTFGESLQVALADLTSIADSIKAECRLEDGTLHVDVGYELKIGELRRCVVVIYPGAG